MCRESLANHDHIPKRLKSSKFVRVKAFPMYGGIGVSAPSLHRESTDSLIILLYLSMRLKKEARQVNQKFFEFKKRGKLGSPTCIKSTGDKIGIPMAGSYTG